MDGFTFLQNPGKTAPQPVYVLSGDELFLKRHVLVALRKRLLGEEENDFGWSVFSGDKATWAAVAGELSTLPFGGSRRVVVVDGADPFVTAARDRLEHYVAAPAATGVLILDVKSWPANTKLAKLVPEKATLNCKTLSVQQLPAWCQKWCQTQLGKSLSASAADLLVDLVGPDMGLLDQELNKLAVYVGSATKIDTGDVDQLVGNNREQDVWKIFDMIGSGQTANALAVLDRLLTQGEEPLKLLGAFGSKLRGMTQAYRLTTFKRSLSQAFDEIGLNAFARRGAEQMMRHLTGRRLNRVYDWLLQTNFGMKGGSQLPKRTQMERLVIELTRKQTS